MHKNIGKTTETSLFFEKSKYLVKRLKFNKKRTSKRLKHGKDTPIPTLPPGTVILVPRLVYHVTKKT